MAEVKFEELVQRCYDELKDIFVTMKYSLVGVEGGRKAFNLLLNSILDKYPSNVNIEACKLIITDLRLLKQIEK